MKYSVEILSFRQTLLVFKKNGALNFDSLTIGRIVIKHKKQAMKKVIKTSPWTSHKPEQVWPPLINRSDINLHTGLSSATVLFI